MVTLYCETVTENACWPFAEYTFAASHPTNMITDVPSTPFSIIKTGLKLVAYKLIVKDSPAAKEYEVNPATPRRYQATYDGLQNWAEDCFQ